MNIIFVRFNKKKIFAIFTVEQISKHIHAFMYLQ